ncbi:MAG TPA: type III pantothenate kinase [Pirellulaceae bacterium]|nr:type III pantothenate kinase [Pirellulaceae bacterium]
MTLLAVDIGNTSIKLGWFAEPTASVWPQPSQTLTISTRDTNTWQALDLLPAEPAQWLVGSVQRDAEARLARWVEHHRPGDQYRKLSNAELPIHIDVEFPERVGTDRLLAAIGANALREPARAAIVIDAGSAVTVDLIATDGSFQGGVIWPGRAMMTQVLAGNTDALPLITSPLSDAPPAIVGKSTDKAIKSGLFWGNVGAVREFVTQMQQQLPTAAHVFVTGGDAERLAQYACPTAQRVDNLVLAGVVFTSRTLS